MGGVETLTTQKSADSPGMIDEAVGLTHDREFVGGGKPPTLGPLHEFWAGRLRQRSNAGPWASLAYGSLSSGAAGTITSVAIACKHRHLRAPVSPFMFTNSWMKIVSRQLGREGSANSTPTSALALSFGRPGRTGSTQQP